MTTKSTTALELPLPPFFKTENAGEWSYAPTVSELVATAEVWRSQHAIRPSATDTFTLDVLGIDLQKDFCFPQGSLYVGGRNGRGAIEDNARIASFLYRNLPRITNIRTTLDTHFLFQIFFPSFWVTKDGATLSEHTMICVSPDGKRLDNVTPAGDVLHEGVEPNPAMTQWLTNGNYPWLREYVRHYCAELARVGKYTLYLWPYHCLLGTDGHALAGVIAEARLFHGLVRGAQSWCEVKGGNFLTENYSVFKPEVLMRHDGHPLAQRNTEFLKTLIAADAVAVVGQAASHCVKSSIDDLLDEILSQNPDLANKVYILTDCMSAVAVPDGKGGFIADFTPQAEEAFAKFASAGMHLVRSTDLIDDWPGLRRSVV